MLNEMMSMMLEPIWIVLWGSVAFGLWGVGVLIAYSPRIEKP